jgi:hypothetical protein
MSQYKGATLPRGAAVGEFIVKVQASIFTEHTHQMGLVYNEDRSLSWEGALPALVVGLLDGETKAFFWARMVNGQIEIQRKARWQEW